MELFGREPHFPADYFFTLMTSKKSKWFIVRSLRILTALFRGSYPFSLDWTRNDVGEIDRRTDFATHSAQERLLTAAELRQCAASDGTA